jgi:hypothetical protein
MSSPTPMRRELGGKGKTLSTCAKKENIDNKNPIFLFNGCGNFEWLRLLNEEHQVNIMNSTRELYTSIDSP